MYSGETTVTNDQLEGVLKAGDILRVRGLWRSNSTGGSTSSSSSSKKENIQSNNQKVAPSSRDKRSGGVVVEQQQQQQPALSGQIQKIKLVQPTSEKLPAAEQPTTTTTPQQQHQPLEPQPQPQSQSQSQQLDPPAASSVQNAIQALRTYEKKSPPEKPASEKCESPVVLAGEAEMMEYTTKVLGIGELQLKNKENVEANGKKPRSVAGSDVGSNRSKSEVGESVSIIEIFVLGARMRMDFGFC